MNWSIATWRGAITLDQRTPTPASVGSGLDADTDAWIAAVVTAGGTVSSPRQLLVDALIIDLKADGIWSKLDRLWIFAAENSQSALVDLKALATASAVNTPTFTVDDGYTGNGTSAYILSNFNPTSGSPNFIQDSANYFVWDFDGAAKAGTWVVGYAGGGSSILNINYSGNGHEYYSINEASYIEIAAAAVAGLYCVTRTGSGAEALYVNGALRHSGGNASTAVTNDNLVCLGYGSSYGNRQVSCFGFGGGLNSTEQTALYTRLRTYMTAVGVP